MVKGRVLHVIASLGAGGAERQLSFLTTELVRRGWEVHVLVRAGGQHVNAVSQGGATIHYLRSAHAYDPTVLARTIAIMLSLRPALVQTWLPQSDVIAGTCASLLGIPWILCERSAAPAYSSGWRDRLRHRVGGLAAAVIANSEEGISYWRSHVDHEAILRVIPNGVAIHENVAMLERSRRILAIGRLVQQEKNPFAIALAMRLVARRYGLGMDWCGDGPDYDRLCDLLSFYELSHDVTLHRHCDDVASRLRTAAGFISASFFEGQPNAVLEAMANGCPAIVSDIPAHRAILDENSALFFNPASPSDLATALIDLMENPVAASERAAVAHQRVKKHSVATMADEYEQLYAEMLSRRPA
jgi:glycosyltransferase involved in cell wall biosynthesis